MKTSFCLLLLAGWATVVSAQTGGSWTRESYFARTGDNWTSNSWAREDYRFRIANTNIDMPGYLDVSQQAARLRETRRLTEDDFIRMAKESGTVLLDARSAAMYRLLHVQGAVNLSFTDFTAESLAKTIPDKGTRVLIYCNNNFANEPQAFASKSARASLNLSTYIALHTYGYTNIYELGPFLDVNKTKIGFVRAAPPVEGQNTLPSSR